MLVELSNPELTRQEWKEVERGALEAAEDFRAICSAINTASQKLSANYRMFHGNDVHEGSEIVQFGCLSQKYKESLNKAQTSIVKKINKLGNSFSTFDEYLKSSSSTNEVKTKSNYAKTLAWNKVKGNFLELLCLLSILSPTKPIEKCCTIKNVFHSLGPIPIVEDGIVKNVWTQQTLSDTISGFNARPDIIIAQPSVQISSESIIDIIECKCVKNISSSAIRSEFGKAHDLRVNSYTIISYYDVDNSIIESSKKLGIKIIQFMLNTPERNSFIENPEELSSVLSEKIQQSRKEKDFLKMLESAASESKSKLLIK